MHLPLKDKNIFSSAMWCLVSTLSQEELKNSKDCDQNREENLQKKIDPGNKSFLPSFLQAKHKTSAHLWMPFIPVPAVRPQLWELHRACCPWVQVTPCPMGKFTTWKSCFPAHHTCSTDPAGKSLEILGKRNIPSYSFDSQLSFLRTGLWNQFFVVVHKTTIKICHLDKINNSLTSAPSHTITTQGYNNQTSIY